jgi:Arc/MetJ-type ribon-helix-helix transcriptional regulator
MNGRTVVVEINQQQAQMLDRLIAGGEHGDSYGEVIRSGFLRFCREHPELGADVPEGSNGEVGHDG